MVPTSEISGLGPWATRLDYCNSLMYGTMDTNFVRLQRIQKAAARLIVRVPKYASVTPVLRDLHWLSLRERAHFKVLELFHRAVNNCGPMYLCDLVSLHKPARFLRSAEKHLLVRPRTRCKVRDTSFVTAAPDPWNDLPVSLREPTSKATFKRTFKTLYVSKYVSR